MVKRRLRRSQVIVPFGTGSIVDFPDESLMTCSIDLWPTINKIYDERLQKRLSCKHRRIDFFVAPPSAEEGGGAIPFVRFPRWLFCPRCRSLKHVDDWMEAFRRKRGRGFDVPLCFKCNVKLAPSRFVVICENGHIDDFPWVEWVHKDTGVCKEPQLTITTGSGSSGLSGIRIKCSCGATETMKNAFTKDELKSVIGKCSGFMPWQHPGKTVDEDCEADPQTAQRGGTNVYFPNIFSSILIPPYSSGLRKKIKAHSLYDILSGSEFDNDDEVKLKFIKAIARDIGSDEDSVRSCLNGILKEQEDYQRQTQDEIEYRYDEFKAFCDGEASLNSGDFLKENVNPARYGFKFIDKIVLVHRLREIRTLYSFTRLKPVDIDLNDSSGVEERNKRYKYVNEKHDLNYLPAFEVRGEGIFLSLKNDMIEQWANDPIVKHRAEMTNQRYRDVIQERGSRLRIITPKFILLHTFAHLLIRQFSFECGYSSAALRERIYCNESDNQPEMAGILIYTAGSDAEGSMGGLVREGRPDYFPRILTNAFRKAMWCSSDPLCIESQGQGLDSLNLAACHACVLLPETSCEERNRFLDRGLLVGPLNEAGRGFFKDYLCI